MSEASRAAHRRVNALGSMTQECARNGGNSVLMLVQKLCASPDTETRKTSRKSPYFIVTQRHFPRPTAMGTPSVSVSVASRCSSDTRPSARHGSPDAPRVSQADMKPQQSLPHSAFHSPLPSTKNNFLESIIFTLAAYKYKRRL